MPQTDENDTLHRRIPAEFIRYAAALEPRELAWGHLNGRLTPEDTVHLAFLRRCDLGAGPGEAFARIHKRGSGQDRAELDAVCGEVWDLDGGAGGEAGDGEGAHAASRVWDYLELAWHASRAHHDSADSDGSDGSDGSGGLPGDEPAGSDSQLDDGRREFLLARAASGRGMNWQEGSALLGTDRPEEVDAAFERGEELVGVAVIGLALTHPDAAAILPRIARTLEHALASSDPRLRHQGIVALAHTARLHLTVDRRCLDLLRRCPRGNEADDDLWGYVARRRLPWWLWRHQLGQRRRRLVRWWGRWPLRER